MENPIPVVEQPNDDAFLVEDGGDESEDYESCDEEHEFDHLDEQMGLTLEEHEWALRIKEILQQDPELSAASPVSDMMIAQIALVSMADEELFEGDEDHDLVEGVKERIKGIQRVQTAFEVVEDVSSAKALIRRWVQDLLPGFVLSFYFCPSRESYVSVLDMTQFDMEVFSDLDRHVVAMKGMYYLYQCQNATLAATRMGMVSLCECEGYFWKHPKMVQVKAFRNWAELASGYPLNFSSILHFHTGMFMNLATSMVRKLFPTGVASKFQFGAVSPKRLDQIYLQPSLEVANERLISALHQALELRFQNEATFRL